MELCGTESAYNVPLETEWGKHMCGTHSRLLYCLACSQIRHPHHGAVENGQEVSELLQEKKTALNPNKAEIPTPNKKKHDYPLVSCFTHTQVTISTNGTSSNTASLSALQSYSQPTQNSPPSARRYSYVPETLSPTTGTGRKQSPPNS